MSDNDQRPRDRYEDREDRDEREVREVSDGHKEREERDDANKNDHKSEADDGRSQKSDLHRLKDLPPRRKVLRRVTGGVIVMAVLLCLGTARTLFADLANAKTVDAVQGDTEKTYVQVAMPKTPNSDTSIALPGTAYGFVQSPIYARATGYVHAWYADIGAHVKAGQLLALLDTPELDRELSQAVAQQKQAAAGLALARTTALRWRDLRANDAVSQQDYDNREGQYQQAIANTAAAQANVERLQQLEGFKRIVAPFDGTVSQRNIDVGDLIVSGNQGAGGSTDKALFMMSQVNPLRVYVQVPQSDTPDIHVGDHIEITQGEFAGRHFDGVITHTAGAIDIATRTLQVEIRVPNPDSQLLPGAYVLVHIPTRENGRLLVPGNALLFRKEGTSVAVVRNDNTIDIRAIHIARDLGKTLEVDQGVQSSDRVVLNPGDAMESGDHVVVEAQQHRGQDAKGGSGQGGKA